MKVVVVDAVELIRGCQPEATQHLQSKEGRGGEEDGTCEEDKEG